MIFREFLPFVNYTVIKLYIPAGNIFRCIASLLFLVVNGPIAATLFSWCYSVQTDVKLLTVIWMSEFRMINDHSSRVHLTFSWTFEAVFQFFVYYSASLSKKKKSNLMRVYRPYCRFVNFCIYIIINDKWLLLWMIMRIINSTFKDVRLSDYRDNCK